MLPDNDYRLKDPHSRRILFEHFLDWSIRHGDCDPAMWLMQYVNERMELNSEQRLWFAWLYGNTYNLPSAWIILNEFPDYENVDQGRLEKWNREAFHQLRYQSDTKWAKGHLSRMFQSYREMVGGGSQADLFEGRTFDELYSTFCKRQFKFGRYTTWFYLQTLNECCGIPLNPTNLRLDDPSAKTQRKGLLLTLGREGEEATTEELEQHAAALIEQAKGRGVSVDNFQLETILCAFSKYFREKKGRYLGYYLDRQRADIEAAAKVDRWYGIDWDLLRDGTHSNPMYDVRSPDNPAEAANSIYRTGKPYIPQV